MLAIISPSKNLEDKPVHITSHFSLPEFQDEASQLAEKLKTFSPAKLGKLMDINPKLALLNAERYHRWMLPFTEENSTRAIQTFSGEVFNGLKANTLKEKDLLYAQDHVRILSGLYGILRPLDLMMPYRLEMGTSLTIGRKKDLYAWWGMKLTQSLNRELEAQGEKVLLNLASDEYFSAVNPDKINSRIVKCMFKEESGGKLRFVTVFGKKARGLMLRFMIENRIDRAEDLKAFDLEGYYFNPSHSGKDVWMFTRL